MDLVLHLRSTMSVLPIRPMTGALFLLILTGIFIQPSGGSAQQPAAPTPRALPTESREWKGDFDGMVTRRFIRVLVPYSRSLYFNDKGRERGLTADLVRAFERYLNQKYAKQLGNRPITVYMAPTTRDELLQDVADGFADAAAGNLTVTEERKRLVDFVAPADQKPVSELVLTGPKSPAIAAADDLAGKTVHVRKASSYYESLLALNDRLQKVGKPAVNLVLVPDALEDEDMMEMLNAGLLEAIVVDDWKAKMWAQVLPKIKVNTQAVLRDGGLHGVAIRKDSPQLVAELMDFWVRVYKQQNLPSARMAHYYQRIKQIQDPTGSTEWQRFEEMLALFQKYGE